jgi:hypothetical protein
MKPQELEAIKLCYGLNADETIELVRKLLVEIMKPQELEAIKLCYGLDADETIELVRKLLVEIRKLKRTQSKVKTLDKD